MCIAPTMACNLACTYCYEAGYHSSQTMRSDVEEALIDLVRRELRLKPRPVSVSWYGGEPLLVPDRVTRISRAFRDMADEAKVTYWASMVTNGTLLSQDLVNELIELRVRSMQITVDGPRRIHDARRRYASGIGSTYDVIMHNLATIDFGPIAVSVRCNIDKTNTGEWKELVREIHSLGLTKFWVYPGLVLAWGGFCSDASQCLTNQEFLPVKWEFEAFSKTLGFKAGHNPSPRAHYCGADSTYGFTLGPDGSIYRCWNHIGDKSRAVGNILLSHSNPSPILDWVTYDPTKDEQCRDCDILPICLGGCPEKASYQASGTRACDLWRLELEHALQQWAQEWHKEVGISASAGDIAR